MLNEYRQSCKDNADLHIPGWESLTKNQLCYQYIENEHDEEKCGAYFSALLYKYWPLIPKFHGMSYNVADPEEVYSWLVDSITYALKHRRWMAEDSNIYKDDAGPDKVINRRMKCARLTYYQFINRKKRKQDFELLSLDQLQETFNDNLDLIEPIMIEDAPIDLNEFIKESFNKKDYFQAFLLDIFLTESIFEKSADKPFNTKRVIKTLKNLDEAYCIRFAHTYELEPMIVIDTLKYFKKNSTRYLQQKIEYYILNLIHNKVFKEVLNVN